MTVPAPVARFDDVAAGRSLQFARAQRVIRADRPAQVRPALAEVEEAVAGGAWAFGMIAYEAAAGLDAAARVHAPQEGLPLVWFGIAEGPDEVAPPLTTGEGYQLGPWVPDWTSAQHASRVAAVRAAIAEGDTYQCNLTTRLRSTFAGDAFGLYGELAHRQRGAHHAYVDLGRHTVVSASPESFLRWEHGLLRTAPMKGTAARGRSPQEDRAARDALLASEKDRAENVMIVDLLRNDLARVCEPGSVQVTDLLRVEDYPTLWQLTSSVQGRPRSGTGLVPMLEALFPCGSITGAPKLSTMALIAELEDSPRGAYCGALGFLAPGPQPRARFNVAIRTVVIDGADGSAVYGAGGGVTWASTAPDEYEELLVKAAVLPVGTRDPFALLETFAVVGGIAQHLDEHLDRLCASAAHFGISAQREAIEAAALQAAAEAGPDAVLLRVALRRGGCVDVTSRPLAATPGPVRLVVDTVPTAFPTGLSGHKTTVRGHFLAARERHPDASDVVLLGEHGRAVETTISSLAARIDGTWCTPPLADGCLAGVGRRLSLERGELQERPLTVQALRGAEELAVLSSARGWRPAVLVEGPTPPHDTAGVPREH
ncbi:aminodeoxychorismate synthase, component I [Brachybacterium vulturis]|uniref:Aminodeoxychorismate synthase, component I n=1 Tax=Brachybacterium vulturis TaxID=2017484 RepID=A0A291GKP2_9MICO|nr:aminodeoxychorismate synthase component I [Brachybacterium vulturis]ATG50606.1 aminodeoxychorismate synthase, component I [Brachybacterium vulturis]